MQGNCSIPISTQEELGLTGPPMVEAKPRMCLLVFVGDCFAQQAPGESAVLLDNLYLRQNIISERYVDCPVLVGSVPLLLPCSPTRAVLHNPNVVVISDIWEVLLTHLPSA